LAGDEVTEFFCEYPPSILPDGKSVVATVRKSALSRMPSF